MDLYKLFTYKEGTLNVPQFINTELSKEYTEQHYKYLIFAQEDVINNAKDKEQLCKAYTDFMDFWKLPFTTYAFYGRFNSVMPETANRPNPKLIIECKKGKVCVIGQPAYGFLIVNIEMLKSKNIKCDESYPEIFYLQDLAEKCYKENLWISNNNFLDINESWTLFKEHKNNGYNIDIKKFVSEKNRYNQIPRNYKPLNDFIENFKKYINDEASVKIEEPKQENNDLIDLSKLIEESK